jgi:hypothetical protein
MAKISKKEKELREAEARGVRSAYNIVQDAAMDVANVVVMQVQEGDSMVSVVCLREEVHGEGDNLTLECSDREYGCPNGHFTYLSPKVSDEYTATSMRCFRCDQTAVECS